MVDEKRTNTEMDSEETHDAMAEIELTDGDMEDVAGGYIFTDAWDWAVGKPANAIRRLNDDSQPDEDNEFLRNYSGVGDPYDPFGVHGH